MGANKLVIGSRGSKLALWQANYVREQLLEHHDGLEVEVKVIRTRGDKIQDVAFPHFVEIMDIPLDEAVARFGRLIMRLTSDW